jgi:excisionase family DNA binding protein
VNTRTHPDELLLTATQVGVLFGVGRRTINRWADEGRLPAITTPGGQRRYRHRDITPILAAAAVHTYRVPAAARP